VIEKRNKIKKIIFDLRGKNMYQITFIKSENELKPVLEFSYNILGQHLREVENYKYEDWKERIDTYSGLLVYAHIDDTIISAVLGRKENNDSLVMGFVACDENFRMKGITKQLIEQFEINAKKLGFKYITLGAYKDAEEFYKKCGYTIIKNIHNQNIFQKFL
jgi:GNAT superfamily N-acetyltransferase